MRSILKTRRQSRAYHFQFDDLEPKRLLSSVGQAEIQGASVPASHAAQGTAEGFSRLDGRQHRGTGTSTYVGAVLRQRNEAATIPADQFVTSTYNVYLDRSPSAAELSAWVGALNQGASRQSVLHDLRNSSEARLVAGKTGGVATESTAAVRSASTTGGSPADNSFVTGLYNRYLDRSPTDAEISVWVGELEQGVSRKAVARDIRGSRESDQAMGLTGNGSLTAIDIATGAGNTGSNTSGIATTSGSTVVGSTNTGNTVVTGGAGSGGTLPTGTGSGTTTGIGSSAGLGTPTSTGSGAGTNIGLGSSSGSGTGSNPGIGPGSTGNTGGTTLTTGGNTVTGGIPTTTGMTGVTGVGTGTSTTVI